MFEVSKLPIFTKATILVVGDLMLDRYWYGEASRISPEAPVPIVKVSRNEERLGGAGNVALNLQSLGSRAILMGVVGDNKEADILRELVAGAEMQAFLQSVPDTQTITKLRVISHNQQLIRLDFEDNYQHFDKTELLLNYNRCLPQVDLVIISDYNKGTISDPQVFIQSAKALGIPVVVDPKGDNFFRYRGATLLTPNRKEFEAVVGKCATEAEIVEKAHTVLEQYDIRALLITRGEQGMTLFRLNESPLHLPARAREVYDVTGAGDTVIAVLGAAIAAGNELTDATQLANIAASLVVGRLGAASVTVPELRRALQKIHGVGTGTLSEDHLITAVQDARAHGERIVMTNGCFDILHAGHVAYLAQAKALGDRLIVAVNDDLSVRNLKGPGRPINPLARRMSVLAGLESVDWVVPFSESTPERLIKRVTPDVLVKGGDYKVEQIAGHEHVLGSGGEVKILDFEPGCSTTEMVNTILQRTLDEA